MPKLSLFFPVSFLRYMERVKIIYLKVRMRKSRRCGRRSWNGCESALWSLVADREPQSSAN